MWTFCGFVLNSHAHYRTSWVPHSEALGVATQTHTHTLSQMVPVWAVHIDTHTIGSLVDHFPRTKWSSVGIHSHGPLSVGYSILLDYIIS